jgi:hypothetical protein
MKTTLITLAIIFFLGCGKDKNQDQAYNSNKGIELCSNFTDEEYCSCLDRIAYNTCGNSCNDVEYGKCVAHFLEDAYLNYCNIDRRRSSR